MIENRGIIALNNTSAGAGRYGFFVKPELPLTTEYRSTLVEVCVLDGETPVPHTCRGKGTETPFGTQTFAFNRPTGLGV